MPQSENEDEAATFWGDLPLSEASAWRDLDGEQGFPDPLIEQIALRFRLLGEPLRLKLVAALANGERSVSELVALTGAGQPNVSKHLAALAQGGLVRRRKAGLVALYAIADPLVLRLCDVLCAGVRKSAARQARALGVTATIPADAPRESTSPPRSNLR